MKKIFLALILLLPTIAGGMIIQQNEIVIPFVTGSGGGVDLLPLNNQWTGTNNYQQGVSISTSASQRWTFEKQGASSMTLTNNLFPSSQFIFFIGDDGGISLSLDIPSTDVEFSSVADFQAGLMVVSSATVKHALNGQGPVDFDSTLNVDAASTLESIAVANPSTFSATVQIVSTLTVNDTSNFGSAVSGDNFAVVASTGIEILDGKLELQNNTFIEFSDGTTQISAAGITAALASTKAISIPNTTGTNTLFDSCILGSTLTITTSGSSRLGITFVGAAKNQVGTEGIGLTYLLDGAYEAPYSNNDSTLGETANTGSFLLNVSFTAFTDVLTAGAHTVCLSARTTSPGTWDFPVNGSGEEESRNAFTVWEFR